MFPSPINDPSQELFIYPISAIFVANFCLFIFCQTCGGKDNSWIDAQWGMTFIIPNVIIIVMRALDEDDKITPRMLIATIPVCLWGLRLSYHIWSRHKREDYRYK